MKNGSDLMEQALKLKKALTDGTPRLDTERMRFLLEAYEENNEQPAVIKRAKLLEKVLKEKTIYIDENPIVGTITKYRAGMWPYPEWACRWMQKEVDQLSGLGRAADFTEEDKTRIKETVDYWQDKCISYDTNRIYTQATGQNFTQLAKSGAFVQVATIFPLGFVCLDYMKVLNKGLNGVLDEVEEQLAGLDITDSESLRKRHFYNALVICLEAVKTFAGRYAALAREMAQKETSQDRKKELEEIAEICDWVPANPPRNFREAIQSFWFTLVCAQIETNTWGIVPGRLPLYFHPFYKKDKEEGKISKEEAKGLLAMLFIKFQEIQIHNSMQTFVGNQGQMALHISLGGVDEVGEDATNEVDWLILEVQEKMKCAQPSLTLLYHNRLSEDFLLKAIDVIRTGIGQPQFLGSDGMVQRLCHFHPGIPLEDARGATNIGCVPVNPSGSTQPIYEGVFNLAKMTELAMNNGKDPLTGIQVGPETGEAESFETYEDFWEAVKEQTEYCMKISRDFDRLGITVMAEKCPLPFQSSLISDCIPKGKDLMEGGARYASVGYAIITGIDLANSVTAIKKLVFDDKVLTMKRLNEALSANFEGDGHGDVQRMCLEAPKYGNDDPYADEIARDCYNMAWEAHQKTGPDALGRWTRPEAFSVSIHNEFGYKTGALPTGRNANVSLTDASVSAMPGTDLSGPTALVASAAKAVDTMKYGSNHLNLKFHPSALEGAVGGRKLLALIKTYMDLGGHHVQFNCIDSDVMKDAQATPDDYRDLVVRVAGFSAFFIHLDKGVQDEMIKRSELKFE